MPDLLSPVWAQPELRPVFSLTQWESVLGQARQAGLMGRLAQHHLDHGWMSEVPAHPRWYLEGAIRQVDRLHHELRWEIDCVRRALAPLGVPFVLLKGAAYFAAELPPRRGRLFGDIDIMVRREHLPQVEGALFRAGWISDERDAYNQRYYREWMHEIPPMRHVQRGTVIDVHHTITPPTSRMCVDGEALLELIVAIDGRQDVYVLAPVDMVLHSAVHLFQEGEFERGLRDLLDLNDLVHHFEVLEPDFWHQLIARAHTLELQTPLHHALFHLERLFGTHAPASLQDAVEALRPPWWQQRLMAVLLGAALRPVHPSCRQPGEGLARWLLYVRSHALRMPMTLLVPHLVRKAWMQRFPTKKPEVHLDAGA
ncbi:MAG: nucleotidyltransferase family protein [Burkholderiaceae bacterium]|nr:nucleotidyltransferase family protein [Burkholderiaceae bacterium]